MLTFTPGPWIVDGLSIRAAERNGKQPRIAAIHTHPLIHPVQAVGNAAMIAAAPELLAALKPLAAWAENERRNHQANYGEENEAAYMGALADAANAAISKAEGASA